MGPDLEMEGKSNTMMQHSATKQNNGSVGQDPQHKLMFCASNVDDNTLLERRAKAQNGIEDSEVNISQCTKSSDQEMVEAECQDETENSSSFGDTLSGSENASMSDVEVESPFFGGNAFASVFDGYNRGSSMRKKRLTDHWRRYVRPIMWRCKWIELQIKEFQSKALKYDRELAQYDQRKLFDDERFTLDGLDAKSRPFFCQSRRNQVMKRKNRRRVEDTTDLASYMSSHNLFSYHEYEKSVADGACVDNDCGNIDNQTVNGNNKFEVNERCTSLEFRDSDVSLEQMLWKIEMAQSQVRKLKTRTDKVVSENPGKFTSVNRLSLLVPCDALTSSDRNAASPSENRNGMLDRSLYISSQHISECNMGDLFMPESAVSSHGAVTLFPDMMIESTGLLQVRGSCEDNKEGILIHSQASDEELHNFERVISQLTEKPPVPTKKLNAIPTVTVPEDDPPMRTSVPHGQPSTSRPNSRNSKRKRKSCTGKWRRRSSG